MTSRSTRTALGAIAFALSAAFIPGQASAQVTYTSCTPGVCGWLEATLTGTTLTLKVQNLDNTVGSALYHASVNFVNPFTAEATASPLVSMSAGVNLYGGALLGPATNWSFGNSYFAPNTIDLSNFINNWIEGTAPTVYRAADGAYETTGAAGDSYVQFTADLSAFTGINGNSIASLGFDTDVNPAPLTAVPEPASVVLLATGLLGIGGVAARRRAKL